MKARNESALGLTQKQSTEQRVQRPRATKWPAVVVFTVFFGWLNRCPASTEVSGNVVGQHWTKAGSPYLVTGDILVATLTIDPGVWVLFQSNYVFEVAGTLRAIGTNTDPIVFTRTNTPGGWQGLYFNYSLPGSSLAYCVISNSASSGIRILMQTAPEIRDCIIASNSCGSSGGGGIWADIATNDFVLQNCTIAGNSSTSSNGGGVWCQIASGNFLLRNCWVLDNSSSKDGGGLYVSTAPPYSLELESCTVARNRATIPNGTIYGGGIFANGNMTLRRSLVTSNVCASTTYYAYGSYAYGGGIHAAGGNVALYNCQITGNLATGHYGSYGGGVAVVSGSVTAGNCTFLANDTSETAGTYVFVSGLYLGPNVQTGRVSNCTFAYNTQFGLWTDNGRASVLNSILYFNKGGGAQLYGTTNVAYCDVQNGIGGIGNINFNPIFSGQSDLRLLLGSKCIDAGNPDVAYNDTCFPPSLGDVRNDMGAYGGPSGCNWLSGAEPVIVFQPQPQASCLGQTAALRLAAVGSEPLSYQWWFAGAPLSGQTTTNLLLANLLASQAGPYWAVVSNVFGSVTSAPAQLVVNDACVDLRMYAGLNISGQPGATYVLSYTSDLSNTNSWLPLATNVMPPSGWFYLDMASPFSPYRFYRVKLKP